MARGLSGVQIGVLSYHEYHYRQNWTTHSTGTGSYASLHVKRKAQAPSEDQANGSSDCIEHQRLALGTQTVFLLRKASYRKTNISFNH